MSAIYFYIEQLQSSEFLEETHYLCAATLPPEQRQPQCHFQPQNSRNILIIGAVHFVGAQLVSHFASENFNVLAVSSFEDLLYGDELVWYRQEQLWLHHGVKVKIANLTNDTQVEDILTQVDKEPPSMVIYVPPEMSIQQEKVSEKDDLDITVMSKALVQFVSILEKLRAYRRCTRVILVSHSKLSQDESELMDSDLSSTKSSKDSVISSAWMQTFESVLSTYFNLYNIPTLIIKLSGVFGPWGGMTLDIYRFIEESGTSHEVLEGYCWYIRDVTDVIFDAMSSGGDCKVVDLGHCLTGSDSSVVKDFEEQIKTSSEEKRNTNLQKALKWAASYTKEREATGNRVIFTSYFTSTEDPQRVRQRSSNRFQYMAEFYWSLKKLNMIAVIFHDGLDPGFQHRVTLHYPKLSFVEVHSLHGRSTNDARFYEYFSYLHEHPEITKVLMTDISDVVFQRDPFELMSLLGDSLVYVGTDIDIFPNMRTMSWIRRKLRGCFGNYSTDYGELSRIMDMETVFNAGTLGGSRHTILPVLTMILMYLDSTPHDWNCNMPAVNLALHKHFFGEVFTGFPLNSRFLRWQNAPKGVYIVHK